MTKYTTVSFPKALIDDITQIVKEVGYWPSTTSFVREACVEKLYVVRKHRAKD
jgi:Arc/MetJ-type ribon-helix-helix transcriptional regulator